MSAILYLTIAMCIVLLSVECSVIRLQEIPLTDEVEIKVVIKEDPNHKGSTVASLRIGMANGKDHNLLHLFKKFVKPTGDIPDFKDRFFIRDNNCPSGQVRKGPICV